MSDDSNPSAARAEVPDVPQTTTTDSLTAMDHSQILHSNPDILGGTPVFVGTRVPVQTLIVYLAKGKPLEEFLDEFPTVKREQAVAFLKEAGRALLANMV
jgi:uncharacterized protein (DUF433 family)